MKHYATPEFWACFNQLPDSVQQLARKNYRILKDDPAHNSLHYKKVARYRSVRVGRHYRALGVESGKDIVWFWIGSHAQYDKLVN